MNIGKLLGGAIVLLILIQLVPYGRDHSNPPVTGEPVWNSERTQELFSRSCRDCHSNETVWPWYTHIAPASWLAQFDVEHGREKFNVSEWGRPGKNEGDEAAEEVRNGKMPPFFYFPLHPEAKLSETERQELVDGLIATFGEEHGHDNEEKE
ncbi:MAG: heme-binding domain-containing protein [Prosthecochloris sp.]|uniref:heme-binding domain-containing protein n=1 Tax=unclassified Prosthecochloris TaxID=2632826 RepID=UPI000DF80BA4|nr:MULTISPECIES: heme-binding domain-containing protein [unclassified Prosthecochloris]MCW8797335.1 heme-binding domain-containing protein [Prosthecochloris sp.]NEX12967.1 cytochrome C [Prosthecochloris sp.]RDD30972.1 cytochrome C [Prosthecochloris sp. ZM]RDD31329.1 cytochrome C [Prosthecochloris sp. ZM]